LFTEYVQGTGRKTQHIIMSSVSEVLSRLKVVVVDDDVDDVDDVDGKVSVCVWGVARSLLAVT